MDRNTNQKKKVGSSKTKRKKKQKAAHDRQTWRPLSICILNIYDTLSSEQSYRVRSAYWSKLGQWLLTLPYRVFPARAAPPCEVSSKNCGSFTRSVNLICIWKCKCISNLNKLAKLNKLTAFGFCLVWCFSLIGCRLSGNWNGRLVSCISHVASVCLSSRGAILVFFPFEIKCQTHIGCRCRRRRRRWGWLTRPRLGLTLTDLVGLVVCPAFQLSWLLFLCYLMLWRLSVTLLCFLLPRDMDLAWQSLRICSQPSCPSVLVLAERKFDLRRILFWFQFNFLRRLSSANNN